MNRKKLIIEIDVVKFALLCCARCQGCTRGEIGIHAWFRSMWSRDRGGSTPLGCTIPPPYSFLPSWFHKAQGISL